MKNLKSLFQHEASQILVVLCFFGVLITLSVVFETVVFIGVGMCVGLVACAIGSTLPDDNN